MFLRQQRARRAQVKRIHEYKRQLLNVLGIIDRYLHLKAASPDERAVAVRRVCVIGGKAAPGYDIAKRIIKLVNAVGDVINSDADIGDTLKARLGRAPNHTPRIAAPWTSLMLLRSLRMCNNTYNSTRARSSSSCRTTMSRPRRQSFRHRM